MIWGISAMRAFEGLLHHKVGVGLELKFYLLSNYLHHVTQNYSKVGAVRAISRPSNLTRGRTFDLTVGRLTSR